MEITQVHLLILKTPSGIVHLLYNNYLTQWRYFSDEIQVGGMMKTIGSVTKS